MQLRRNSIWQRIGYLVFLGSATVLPISAGIWLSTQGFSNYQAAANFRSNALLTTGIITETTIQSGGAATNVGGSLPPAYISTIRFETEQGKRAEFKASDICLVEPLNSCNGKRVQVLYAASNPELAMIKGGSSPLDKVRANIGYGIFFILFGLGTLIVAPSDYRGQFGSTQRN
jgi:hypothetical protein